MTAVMASLVYLTLRQILRTLTQRARDSSAAWWNAAAWLAVAVTDRARKRWRGAREGTCAGRCRPPRTRGEAERSEPPEECTRTVTSTAAEAGVLGNDRRDAAQPNNRRCARFRK